MEIISLPSMPTFKILEFFSIGDGVLFDDKNIETSPSFVTNTI